MKQQLIASDRGVLDYLTSGITLSSSADSSMFAAAKTMLINEKIERAFSGCVGLNLSDWDGDGAVPISDDSLKSAKDFVFGILKAGYDLPDIAPSADGSIGMEWWNGEACVFADVGPKRTTRIYYNPSNNGKYSEEPISWSMGSETIVMKTLTLLKKLFPLKDARTATRRPTMIAGFAQSLHEITYGRLNQAMELTSSTIAPWQSLNYPTPELVNTRPNYQEELDQELVPLSRLYLMAKNSQRIEQRSLQA